MVALAQHLRQWRKEHGYTQQQMADFLVVHRTSYTKYEAGAVEPPLATLCRMADLLGCTTDKLLGRK
ncbi:MAG: helix-turn-helix transcriptional regulator [Clostridia bacterium]|nr:helix-turn-helix transcriptional regulator [Clostridia bacterium]